MKKILASVICVLTVICLICGSSTVFAATDWGTYDEGIIPTRANLAIYHEPYLETNGFPNFNFNEGFKYWTSSCLSGARLYSPSQSAELRKEADNTFIKLTPTEPYGNIHTVQFVDSRIKVDDTLVVVYDWRNTSGDANLQITLNQYFRESAEKLGSHGGTRLSDCGNGGVTDLKVALNDTDWNTSMGRVYQPVLKPTTDHQTIYLSIGIESIVEVTETEVDNIRIAKFVKSTGDVLDLDGKKLFNIHELDIGASAEDEISNSDFDNIDYGTDNEEITEKASAEASATKSSSVLGRLPVFVVIILIVLIAAIAVIIIPIVVVIIIIVAKKKKAAAEEEIAENQVENLPEETE